MQTKPLLIIVSGFPATGKTTLSKKIATEFKVPLIVNDEIKEIIYDSVGNWDDREFSKKVGKAVYDVMYHVAREVLFSGQSCILEAFFLAEFAGPRLQALKDETGCEIFQIHLTSDWEVILRRYDERNGTIERHPCHDGKFDFKSKQGNSKETLIDIDGETMEIDTTDFNKIDHDKIFKSIKEIKDKYERTSENI